MATCPSCGCDLPGTETLCRDCFEKQYAEKFGAKKAVSQRLDAWLAPLLMVAIFAPMFLAPDWFFAHFGPPLRALDRLVAMLGVVLLTAQWVLMGGATAFGIWDSLKARSWKALMLWLMYMPLIVGFLFWKITDRGAWLSVTIAGAVLVAAQRYNARRRGLI